MKTCFIFFSAPHIMMKLIIYRKWFLYNWFCSNTDKYLSRLNDWTYICKQTKTHQRYQVDDKTCHKKSKFYYTNRQQLTPWSILLSTIMIWRQNLQISSGTTSRRRVDPLLSIDQQDEALVQNSTAKNLTHTMRDTNTAYSLT